MDRISATEEEKLMAREFYGQNDDGVELGVTEFTEGTPDGNSLAETDVFKQALLDAQFRRRMKKEGAIPKEKYSKRHQNDVDEQLLVIGRKYSCSPDESVLKYVESLSEEG